MFFIQQFQPTSGVRWLVVFAALALHGCGGGGGSNSDAPVLRTIDRSGFAQGTIDGFGSIFVNGVEYATDTATFDIDDQGGQEASLRVGQVVELVGEINSDGVTGVANRVSVDPLVRGQITSVDAVALQIRVLGSNVIIDGETLFSSDIDPADISTLQLNDWVEVHGFPDAVGDIRATLVERTLDREYELRAVVRNLSANNSIFTLNGQSVDFTNASVEGFANEITAGDVVEVEGDTIDADGVLLAQRVEFEGGFGFGASDEGSDVEIEGFITQFLRATDFEVAGVSVQTTSTTTFVNGTSGDLAPNVRVEVEGLIDAGGILVATEVGLQVESNLVVEATVESFDAQLGTVNVLGLNVVTDSSTQLIDESDANVTNFGIADLAVGDYVKFKIADDGTSFRASLVKRKNPEDKLKIEGAVSAIAQSEFSIGTATIVTNTDTEFSEPGGSIDAVEFFRQLEVGNTVGAEGQSPSDGVLTADEVEFE